MFRPSPQSSLTRRVPYPIIAVVLSILAMMVAIFILANLEKDHLILQGIIKDNALPAELFDALWQSRRDLLTFTFLVVLISAFGIVAVMAYLHYTSTKSRLEEVKGLARNILQSIPSGVLTVDRSGIITAVNPRAEVVLRRMGTELLGNSYEIIFPKGETIRAVLDGALRTDQHVSLQDLHYQGTDGTERTIRVSTAELSGDDGKPAGVIVQAQDMTDWLALEQRVRVAEKLAALHTLSAGVAHELRNPLSAIDLNLQLLDEEIKGQGGSTNLSARYLNVLNTECRRLSNILDNFIKFARPGSVGLHEVQVRALLEHIVSLMQVEAEDHHIRLVQEIEASLPPVIGDETAITQVLVNIVVNGLHAMPHGGLCRIAAETRHLDGKVWVVVSVKDTGVGIEKDALSRLFEPFYTTKSDGTGLGLTIAYRIMEDHGGSIHVSSQPGKGTTITLMFPASVQETRLMEQTT
jgi:PAS domain S-box-containing protein